MPLLFCFELGAGPPLLSALFQASHKKRSAEHAGRPKKICWTRVTFTCLEIPLGYTAPNTGSSAQCIDNDVYGKLGVVLGQKSLVAEIVVPFAAIILVAVEQANFVIDRNGFKVVVH